MWQSIHQKSCNSLSYLQRHLYIKYKYYEYCFTFIKDCVTKVHSAVLPYLHTSPFPIFLKFRVGEASRGSWKSVFLINFYESFKHKLSRKHVEEIKNCMKIDEKCNFLPPLNFFGPASPTLNFKNLGRGSK